MTLAPLSLPKFTLLCAPAAFEHGQRELANEISSRDPSLGVFDFEEPLRLASMQLFENSISPSLDLTNALERTSPVLGGSLSYDAWLKLLRPFIEQKVLFGLAGIFYHHFMTDYGAIHDRVLVRDCTSVDEANILAHLVGAQHVCLIHCGGERWTTPTQIRRQIWLDPIVSPDPIVKIETELETLNA